MSEQPKNAYRGDGPYVFISYAHADTDAVYGQIRWLQEQGVNVWYDNGISAGSEWSETLARAIKGATQVIYFVSPRSVRSENCRRELNFALEEHRPVLAVHIEPTEVPDGMRLSLNNRQALFKHSDSAYQQKLLAALEITSESNASTPTSAKQAAPQPTSPRRSLLFVLIAMSLIVVSAGAWYLLQSSDSSPSNEIRSIAVLPFENLSGNPNQDYVADGMTGALINELGKLELLTVMSRRSVMRYKQDSRSPREIGAELGVRALVGGAVFKEGDQYRVTVELIDAENDRQIWNDQFDRKLAEVLALHADVARSVASEIQLELSPQEESSLTAQRLIDPIAYDALQKGHFHQNSYSRGNFSKESLLKAVDYYKQAIAQDETWAEPYDALAGAYHFLGTKEYMILSKETALKALALDDGLAGAHASLAYVLSKLDQDWEGSAREYQRAFELNPKFNTWGYASLMELLGRWDEAIDAFKQAEEGYTTSLDIKTQLGVVYMCASRYEDATQQLQKVLELNPNYAEAHIALGYVHLQLSNYQQAVAAMERAEVACRETLCRDGYLPLQPALGEALARAGRTEEALKIVEQKEASNHASFAGLYDALGRREDALTQLERAIQQTDPPSLYCSRYQKFADEPRFIAMMQQMYGANP